MVSIVEGFVNGERYEITFPDGIDEAEQTRATQEFFESLPLMGVRGSPSDLFTQASEFTLNEEGGFVDDPDDPGGMTKYGISKRAFPKEDIENLTLDRATNIYRETYWEKPNMDQIPYDTLAVKAFDAGVNMGTRASGKLLQRALNDIQASPDGEARQMVTVDGRIGPSTLAAIARADEQELTDAFVKRMKKRYGDIVEDNPKSMKFLKGWIKRAERLPITKGE